jgi:hypothetical protein
MKIDPCDVLVQIADAVEKSKEGLTIQGVAREVGINWRTSKKYLETLAKLSRRPGTIEVGTRSHFENEPRRFKSATTKASFASLFFNPYKDSPYMVCRNCFEVVFRSENHIWRSVLMEYFDGICPACRKPLDLEPVAYGLYEFRNYKYVRKLRGWVLAKKDPNFDERNELWHSSRSAGSDS